MKPFTPFAAFALLLSPILAFAQTMLLLGAGAGGGGGAATVSFDVSGSGTDASCTTCAGQALSLTGSNDAVVQIAMPNTNMTAITSPYSTHAPVYNGSGEAVAVGLSSGAAPNWTQNNAGGVVAVAAIALKGGGSGTTWTFVQIGYWDGSAGSSSGSGCAADGVGTTCTITGMTAVGAGHSLIGFALYLAGSTLTVSLNGETWTHCTNCAARAANDNSTDMAYVTSAVGGETTFTCTMNSPPENAGYFGCGVIEVRWN